MPDEGTPEGQESEGGAPAAGDSAPETFDRDYVEKLRDEAANYRVRSKEWAEATDGYTPEQQQQWRRLIKAAMENPAEGVEALVTLAQQLDEESFNAKVGGGSAGAAAQAEAAAKASADGESNDSGQGLTLEQVQKMLEERDAKMAAEAKQAAGVQAMKAEAAELGYKPESDEYFDLLLTAQRKTDGDIKEADKLIKERDQRVIDAYLKSKESDAAKLPDLPFGEGTAGETTKAPKTIEGATAALDEWLKQASM